jgi:hypothetical protein
MPKHTQLPDKVMEISPAIHKRKCRKHYPQNEDFSDIPSPNIILNDSTTEYDEN